MADTTTKGFPYPEGPDPVDVAGDIQSLAEAVDNMPGVQSYTQTQINGLAVGERWAGRVVWNSTAGKLQVSNGSTFSDVDTSVALSSSNPSALGVAAAGTGTTASRGDHVHAMPSAADVSAIPASALTSSNPAALGSAAAPGSATNVARLDHVHPFPSASDVGAVANALVGANNGVASLDSSGQVPATQLGNASGMPHALFKTDFLSCCLTRTGNGTVSIKAGTKVLVGTGVVDFATATSVTMPSLTAGTDYFVYALSNGTAQAVAASGTWPTPVASPPANSQLIGGFHYAPGGNATGTSGGNTTPSINEFSLWDLKWRPTSLDPRGMTLVADAFWMDIYLLNRAPDTNGTSKNAADIADGATGGTTTAIIPAKFGGNGTTRYALQDWWSTAECLMAYGKRLPTVAEAATAFYGVTENVSRGNDPVTTGLGTTNAGSSQTDEKFTSKWGVIQATGVMYVWGQEHGGGTAAASWANTNGGRGQVYQQENAVFLSGAWDSAANAGSRSASWSVAPSVSGLNIGGRGACDHLLLV